MLSTVTLGTRRDPAVLHRMREVPRADPTAAPQLLTRRQSQVLGLLADWARVGEIARLFVLSEATVRNHVHAILVGLGAHSQIEAVARARTLGVLPAPDVPRTAAAEVASRPGARHST